MATRKVLSALERFERVAKGKRLPTHDELQELADIASDMKDTAEALAEACENFSEHVETLVDEDGDRDDKREARDLLPEEAETIYDRLNALSGYTVIPDNRLVNRNADDAR